MKCDEVVRYLYKYICQELQQAETQKMVQHLSSCKECNEKYQNLQKELQALHNWEKVNINISTEQILHKAKRRIRWVRYTMWTIIFLISAFLIFIGLDIARYRHEHVLISELEKAIVQYQMHHGSFPASHQNLATVLQNVEASNYYLQVWQKRITNGGDFLDYWGNAIRYRFPGKYNRNFFDLYSCGKDREDDYGLDDDIKNWHPSYEKK